MKHFTRPPGRAVRQFLRYLPGYAVNTVLHAIPGTLYNGPEPMNKTIEILRQKNIHPYASEPALKQEAHVARFLEREYKSLLENPVSLDELGLSTIVGPMFQETEDLMEVHYDEKFEFFDSFLDDKYYAYTMAYYGESAEDIARSSVSLEQAQHDKFRLICDRIGIRGNETILNIGCGFGSFERYLFEYFPDVQVVGVTPSRVQVKAILASMQDPGCILYGRDFRVILKDFNLLSDADVAPQSFDIVCSIGLCEQSKNMLSLNAKVAHYLKPGGRAFHHMISSRITVPQFVDPAKTLIGAYFPGGRIWPMDEMAKHTRDLQLENSWFLNGMNYWHTLDEWHRRFWQDIDRLYEHLSIERLRFWSDYFVLCKACFLPMQGALFGNAHYLFSKPV